MQTLAVVFYRQKTTPIFFCIGIGIELHFRGRVSTLPLFLLGSRVEEFPYLIFHSSAGTFLQRPLTAVGKGKQPHVTMVKGNGFYNV